MRSLQIGSGGQIESASHIQTEISCTKRKLEPTISVRLGKDQYNGGETFPVSVMHTNLTRRKIRKTGAELYSNKSHGQNGIKGPRNYL